MPKFNRLRGLGPLGNAIANIVTFLTTNWQIVVSIIAAIAAGAIDWLRAIALSPSTIAGVGSFLAVLWTIIGVLVLVDRRRPRLVRSHLDYRYGLTFIGLQPNYIPPSLRLGEGAGALQFAISFVNFAPGVIKYELETCDIRVETRASPKLKKGELTGFMSRGATRSLKMAGFTDENIKEFYGKSQTRGTVDFSILYGAVDEPPERRLTMSIEILLRLSQDGERFGYADNITSESDNAVM